MRTLIIHPKDETTTFLNNIYKDIHNVVILNNNYTYEELVQCIIESDNVIMLGHGTPNGLINVSNNYIRNPYIIDSSLIEILNLKSSLIGIWCNADRFFNKITTNSFYSGMFVSESSEAEYMNINGVENSIKYDNDIMKSNNLFAILVGEAIKKFGFDMNKIHKYVKGKYIIDELPIKNVVEFNSDRLYVK